MWPIATLDVSDRSPSSILGGQEAADISHGNCGEGMGTPARMAPVFRKMRTLAAVLILLYMRLSESAQLPAVLTISQQRTGVSAYLPLAGPYSRHILLHTTDLL